MASLAKMVSGQIFIAANGLLEKAGRGEQGFDFY